MNNSFYICRCGGVDCRFCYPECFVEVGFCCYCGIKRIDGDECGCDISDYYCIYDVGDDDLEMFRFDVNVFFDEEISLRGREEFLQTSERRHLVKHFFDELSKLNEKTLCVNYKFICYCRNEHCLVCNPYYWRKNNVCSSCCHDIDSNYCMNCGQNNDYRRRVWSRDDYDWITIIDEKERELMETWNEYDIRMLELKRKKEYDDIVRLENKEWETLLGYELKVVKIIDEIYDIEFGGKRFDRAMWRGRYLNRVD